MNVDFAMSILAHIACSHLPSDVNSLTRDEYVDLVEAFPFTVMLLAGIIVYLENTMVKDFAQFKYKHFAFLYHDSREICLT